MSGLEYLDAHPFVRSTAVDKALGTLIGSALGDCVGLYTEFLPRQEVLRVYPDGRFKLAVTEPKNDSHRALFDPGSWTDDTDHALLLVLSWLHNSSWEVPKDNEAYAADFASRLNSWCNQGLRCLERPPLDLGQTVASTALDKGFVDDPKGIAIKVWARAPSMKPAANGSLMRTHPLGILCVALDEEQTFELAATIGELTHVDPRCVVSCALATSLIRGILRGEILREEDLDAQYQKVKAWMRNRPLDARLGESVDALLQLPALDEYMNADDLEDLELSEYGKIGYVYKCLGSAVLTLRRVMRLGPPQATTFEDLISDLVMQGGDVDTNACVAGAILGAWVGESRLPEQWKNGMLLGEWFKAKSIRFIQRTGITIGDEGASIPEDPDTAPDGGKGFLDQAQLKRMERDVMAKMLERTRITSKEDRKAPKKKTTYKT